MAGRRFQLAGMVLRFVLVVSLTLLPTPVIFAGGSEAQDADKAQQTAARERVETAAEDAQEDAVRPGKTAPETRPRVSVRDPDTGALIDPEELAPEKIVKLPPGDIKGMALEVDGVTAHPGVKLALIDVETATQFASVTTDEKGEFVFTNVSEGRYVLLFGNARMAAVLEVTKQAQPGVVNIVVPKTSVSGFPGWTPGWMQESPVLGTAVVTAAGTTVVAAPVASFSRGHSKRKKIYVSPSSP